MKRYLIDVNVLLALLWPRHESHATAQAWFEKSGQQGWATNPVTQLGVLRLLTNPAVTQNAVSAASAINVLNGATSHAGHEFWPLDRELSVALAPFTSMLKGHQQWTDALLLWHAIQRRGVLVTLDAGAEALAGPELKSHVLLLKRR